MKWRREIVLGGTALTALGMTLALKSCLPQRFDRQDTLLDEEESIDSAGYPAIEVTFLRCGYVHVPEFVAVRGAVSFAARTIAHSAVLVRHPHATFLYDTGLCANIGDFLSGQPLFFRKTLGSYTMEQPLAQHLRRMGMQPGDLDFVLLSHLHWDHVSGVPDLPGVPLRVNRVEYEAARHGLFDKFHNLIPRLLGENPLTQFECTGPAYAGFRASLDLFGDGSVVLVPLPGHTAGNTGLFIQRAHGSRLFLIGDAAWVAENYLRPAPMHPFIWSRVTADNATALQTLLDLHAFSLRHPEIPLIAMHDASMQQAFAHAEAAHAE